MHDGVVVARQTLVKAGLDPRVAADVLFLLVRPCRENDAPNALAGFTGHFHRSVPPNWMSAVSPIVKVMAFLEIMKRREDVKALLIHEPVERNAERFSHDASSSISAHQIA